MRAVDVLGFAGGFSMGMVQAGFDLAGKCELNDFGVRNMEINRHLLGHGWQTQISGSGGWEVVPAEVVFGNPPCS